MPWIQKKITRSMYSYKFYTCMKLSSIVTLYSNCACAVDSLFQIYLLTVPPHRALGVQLRLKFCISVA